MFAAGAGGVCADDNRAEVKGGFARRIVARLQYIFERVRTARAAAAAADKNAGPAAVPVEFFGGVVAILGLQILGVINIDGAV